jgi:hypothetical protein
MNTLCCGYLEYLLLSSCQVTPKIKKAFRNNIISKFTCINDATAGTSACHDPPRVLFTKVVQNEPSVRDRIQGQGVAVVGTSAYYFGGDLPGHVLSDKFFRLDGSTYPPTWKDLTEVCFVMYLGSV